MREMTSLNVVEFLVFQFYNYNEIFKATRLKVKVATIRNMNPSFRTRNVLFVHFIRCHFCFI